MAVQGIRSSARLAAAGPTNPFSTTGITPAAMLLIPHAEGSLQLPICALQSQ